MKKEHYELLSLALSYPRAELLELIRQGSFEEVFGKKAPIPGNLEELEVEYCRLFVGPGHVEVPPYESVYRNPELNMQKGLIMGPAAQQVVKVYEEAGLQLKAEFHDMPDHIAVEFLFMAYLEAMHDSYPEEGFLDKKHAFINNHLGQWALGFADEVKNHGRHAWYLYVADLLAETVSNDVG